MEEKVKKGLLILYTGQGKGKTTAAFGMAYRAMGRGWRVAVVQYIKGKWMTGERLFSAKQPLLDLFVMGEGFTWESADLSRDQAAAAAAWVQTRKLIEAGEHPLVILDEITYALHYGWLALDEVREVFRTRPSHVSIVVTGRHAPEALLEDADLVTEMQAVKHPFAKGVPAQQGLDF